MRTGVIAAAAMAATLGAADDASAGRIVYIFTADDGLGRVAELRLIADAGMGPTNPRQIPGVPGGSSEFTAGRLGPMRAVAYLDGARYDAYEGADPSAILTHLALPGALDLGRFELTRSLQLNDFRGTITSIVVVPEPSSLALAGLGLLGVAGLAGARRARRAA